MITIHPPIRGQDAQGSGVYGAPRGDHTHEGIDFACMTGSLVRAVCAGIVTKIGYPYSQKEPDESWSKAKTEKHLKKKALRYVQVTDYNDNDARYFYVDPSVKVDDYVLVGWVVGETQDLTEIYKGITPHLHFEVKKDGQIINPHEYLGD